MSIQKTLGGDRLGSGKKNKVELHGFERSNHDRGYVWRSTMAAGTLVPFMSEVALPGDTFDIKLDCNVLTLPTLGPLFGSFKTQLDVFQVPMRLYNSLMHNNMLGVGLDMSKVKLPINVFQVPSQDPANVDDVDNMQINPSHLLAYLGLRGFGVNKSGSANARSFQAIPYLAYWEIYKNYYANKQETIGAYIHTDLTTIIDTVTSVQIFDQLGNLISGLNHTPGGGVPILPTYYFQFNYTGTTPDPTQLLIKTIEHGDISLQDISIGVQDIGTALTGVINSSKWGTTSAQSWDYIKINTPTNGKPIVKTFDLANIDEMRKKILAWNSTTVEFPVNNAGYTGLEPYVELGRTVTLPGGGEWINTLAGQEQLALKTYQSDLFNNWLQTEWIDGTSTGINTITAVDTSSGSFKIDSLVLAEKVYKMLNRIAVSGGSFDDWMEAQWAHTPYTRAENPMYMGGLSKELVFQQVISSNTTPGQPLGTLAGRGQMSQKHKGGNIIIKVDEPSYIIGIVSLTPRIDYSQGNKWDTYALKTMADLHVPSLDEIGFQELITEQMAWWDTQWDGLAAKWIQRSAGKQPAWINYMTNVNQVRGNFAYVNNSMFMTLNRRYEYKNLTYSNIKDLTTYIDPSKFNFIFAETSLDAQNFWCQIGVDIEYRGKISAKVMPNL